MQALCFGENAMVIQSATSTSKGNIYYTAGLEPLEDWVNINVYNNFNSEISPLHMAQKGRLVTASAHEPIGDWFYLFSVDLWNYNVLHGEDRYAGIRFKDEDNCVHYGWIRCAVVDSTEQLIIKDYAYETFCDWAIETADTAGGHVGVNENILSDINIYAAQHTINININLTQLIENTTVSIFDMSGKLIYADNIVSLHSQIPLDMDGNFIVVINRQGGTVSKKVMLL